MARVDPGDTGALDVVVMLGLALMCAAATWLVVSPSARMVTGCFLGGSELSWCLTVADDIQSTNDNTGRAAGERSQP